ncbi:AAA family ATPase [Shewanella oneidensis MR-1]|uniref:Mu phage transposase OrfB TnpB_MuSo2 n=1 Tax=Shewanella oneidensis (strain ATCC 700550 / JCM 31522 / CIP 106686 / LMG 19005 / NCIMB 14063 / MR-1) TaxID=211586 RepID=Q8EDT8_SHEON|nr:AAA family ATPase [Shewanella oneidensis]AAN55683.1 Mu phage transposase OrfB TnpB_MuSo2 [Shewanella oneidensis MR-1]MDX5995676.1 AAA family ATPase [Shewanella oneidensis]MEE2026273.1 hypothetical protein [Shewanella oneidensis]QKG97157.1 AAA family ATPase [Shewanella oneidensis MR-1]
MSNVHSLTAKDSKAEIRKTDVVMQINTLIEAGRVVAAHLAQEISVAPSTLSQVLNGQYKANTTQVVKKLDNWLRMREQREANPNLDPGFVLTPTANLVMDNLSYAQITQAIVVIIGASGVGKSRALEEYQRSNNNVWKVIASPSRSSLTELLYEIAMELGMAQAPRTKGPLARVIRQRLKGSEGLIIVDEADHLDYPTLEELRILQEETGIGMALVGNNKVYTQLTGGRRNEDYARLFSRIAKKLSINKTKQADVRAIAKAWNLQHDAEISLMIQISEKPGGLRLLSKTLKLAAMFAKGAAITEALLRTAFNELETNE